MSDRPFECPHGAFAEPDTCDTCAGRVVPPVVDWKARAEVAEQALKEVRTIAEGARILSTPPLPLTDAEKQYGELLGRCLAAEHRAEEAEEQRLLWQARAKDGDATCWDFACAADEYRERAEEAEAALNDLRGVQERREQDIRPAPIGG